MTTTTKTIPVPKPAPISEKQRAANRLRSLAAKVERGQIDAATVEMILAIVSN